MPNIVLISPAFVRGTYGSLIQIATCLGLMAALVVKIPSKDVMGWWWMCFWLSTIPAATLGLGMALCAESPIWLYKVGLKGEDLDLSSGSSSVWDSSAFPKNQPLTWYKRYIKQHNDVELSALGMVAGIDLWTSGSLPCYSCCST